MIYEGCRLTAEEAMTVGLVNDILCPADFQELMMPRVQAIAIQSSHVNFKLIQIIKS